MSFFSCLFVTFLVVCGLIAATATTNTVYLIVISRLNWSEQSILAQERVKAEEQQNQQQRRQFTKAEEMQGDDEELVLQLDIEPELATQTRKKDKQTYQKVHSITDTLDSDSDDETIAAGSNIEMSDISQATTFAVSPLAQSTTPSLSSLPTLRSPHLPSSSSIPRLSPPPAAAATSSSVVSTSLLVSTTSSSTSYSSPSTSSSTSSFVDLHHSNSNDQLTQAQIAAEQTTESPDWEVIT